MTRPSRSAHRLRRTDTGAVAVEFALVLPILVSLLLGVTTAGLSYTHALGLTNAVREGARFGATTNATSSSWADNVISRVRATQFDDPTPETAVCVQLWQHKSSGDTPLTGKCDQGDGSVSPALTLPATAAATPLVPSGLPNEGCVVRVIAARNFTIDTVVLPVWHKTNVSYSVARYERMDVYPSCK